MIEGRYELIFKDWQVAIWKAHVTAFAGGGRVACGRRPGTVRPGRRGGRATPARTAWRLG